MGRTGSRSPDPCVVYKILAYRWGCCTINLPPTHKSRKAPRSVYILKPPEITFESGLGYPNKISDLIEGSVGSNNRLGTRESVLTHLEAVKMLFGQITILYRTCCSIRELQNSHRQVILQGKCHQKPFAQRYFPK